MPKQQPKIEKTKVPGVYRRGNRYVYCYRVDGRQRAVPPLVITLEPPALGLRQHADLRVGQLKLGHQPDDRGLVLTLNLCARRHAAAAIRAARVPCR